MIVACVLWVYFVWVPGAPAPTVPAGYFTTRAACEDARVRAGQTVGCGERDLDSEDLTRLLKWGHR